MGFSTFIYLTAGIKEQCIYFPKKQKFTIALINGFYNLSAGMFVINKLVYQMTDFPVESLLAIQACFNLVPLVKTFFFSAR